MSFYTPDIKFMRFWKDIDVNGKDAILYEKIKQDDQDKKDVIYFEIKKQREETTKIIRERVHEMKNVGLDREKIKLERKKIAKESNSIIGTQDWVNYRVPDRRDKTPHTTHIFPFPGIKQEDLELFKDQHLSYAILIDSHTVRLPGGRLMKVNARTKSCKGNNFASSCTGQNITHALNDSRNQRLRDTQNSEIPDQVTMEDLIRGRVIICAISNIDKMLGRVDDSKISHVIFWLAQPQNAHLLALTGIINDLVNTGLEFEGEDNEFDDFGFTFERTENPVEGNTPSERLIFLLSNPNIMRNNFREISGSRIEETIIKKNSDNSYDSGIIEYEEIEDKEENNLKKLLLSNKGLLLCESWMKKCSTTFDNINDFVEYIFSPNGANDLDILLNYEEYYEDKNEDKNENNIENNIEINEPFEEEKLIDSNEFDESMGFYKENTQKVKIIKIKPDKKNKKY